VQIAILGAAGQIGTPLLESLKRDHTVEGFDVRPAPGVRVLDLTTEGSTEEIGAFDVLYHLAAALAPEGEEPSPRDLAETNIVGTVQVLEAARLNDARMVFTSSVSVYGDPVEVPVPETHPLRPFTAYGLSKLVAERYIDLYRDLYGLDVAVVRPFNVYSDRSLATDHPTEVIGRFFRSARTRQPILVSGDGQQTRDFVHVSDVVQLLALLLDGRGKGGTYNVGSGTPTCIADLAEWVRAVANVEVPIVHTAPRARDVRRCWANIDRARALGYQPGVQVREWLLASAAPRALLRANRGAEPLAK
jgi:UDP-glucose 4-epimerase